MFIYLCVRVHIESRGLEKPWITELLTFCTLLHKQGDTLYCGGVYLCVCGILWSENFQQSELSSCLHSSTAWRDTCIAVTHSATPTHVTNSKRQLACNTYKKLLPSPPTLTHTFCSYNLIRMASNCERHFRFLNKPTTEIAWDVFSHPVWTV